MTQLAAILAGTCLLALPASSREFRDILAAHAEARGGIAAIEAIQSIDIRLTIDEGWVVDGHYRATRAGEMHIDVFAEGERVFTEALQEGSAWSMKQGKTSGSPITQDEANILWRGVLGNIYGLHELEAQGVAVTVSGPVSIDGESFWVVDLLYQDGFEDRYYLDAESLLVVRQRSDHALHPAVDPEIRRFESRYSDYREVDGVLFPFLKEKFDLETGERVQQVTTKSLAINTIDDRTDFAMPQ